MTSRPVPPTRSERARPRVLTALLVTTLLWVAAPATAHSDPPGPGNGTTDEAGGQSAVTPQQVVALGPSYAAANDIEQSVAIVDRATGELVASSGGDEIYATESILKLFTAAYYLVQSDGAPDGDLADQLHALIADSDNDIQSALWQWDIVPSIAERYGLPDTDNGPSSSPTSWGSDLTTANDQALFLYRMSVDPLVGPTVMAAMSATAQSGSDGFDQEYGLNALAGEHGSKQGWSDPGWSPANMHSVGWTGRYFAAILQTSATADYATMRASSTHTAKLIAAAAGEVSSAPGVAGLGRSITRAVGMKDMLSTLGVAEQIAGSHC